MKKIIILVLAVILFGCNDESTSEYMGKPVSVQLIAQGRLSGTLGAVTALDMPLNFRVFANYPSGDVVEVTADAAYQQTEKYLNFWEKGLAFGVEVGETKVSASYHGVQSNSVLAKVLDLGAPTFEIKADRGVVLPGEEVAYRAFATYQDGYAIDLTDLSSWDSNNASIGQFDPTELGHFVTKENGEVELSATYQSLSDYSDLLVLDPYSIDSVDLTIQPVGGRAGNYIANGARREFVAFAKLSLVSGVIYSHWNVTDFVDWSTVEDDELVQPVANEPGWFESLDISSHFTSLTERTLIAKLTIAQLGLESSAEYKLTVVPARVKKIEIKRDSVGSDSIPSPMLMNKPNLLHVYAYYESDYPIDLTPSLIDTDPRLNIFGSDILRVANRGKLFVVPKWTMDEGTVIEVNAEYLNNQDKLSSTVTNGRLIDIEPRLISGAGVQTYRNRKNFIKVMGIFESGNKIQLDAGEFLLGGNVSSADAYDGSFVVSDFSPHDLNVIVLGNENEVLGGELKKTISVKADMYPIFTSSGNKIYPVATPEQLIEAGIASSNIATATTDGYTYGMVSVWDAIQYCNNIGSLTLPPETEDAKEVFRIGSDFGWSFEGDMWTSWWKKDTINASSTDLTDGSRITNTPGKNKKPVVCLNIK
ncbi:hypothetical protein ACNZ70_001719 [Vibrio mimicus]